MIEEGIDMGYIVGVVMILFYCYSFVKAEDLWDDNKIIRSFALAILGVLSLIIGGMSIIITGTI